MKRSFIIPVNLCDIYLKLSHLLLVLSIIMGVSPVFAGDQSTHNKLPGSIAEAKTDTPAIRKNIPVEKSSVRIYVLQGEAQRPERVDSTSSAPHFQDPNLIPYRSHKSFYKHILAFPSTVWNAIWYPLGQGFIWMEQQHLHQKLVAIFTRKRVSGITPIATIGGNTAFAFGLMAYHHNLFGNKEDARLAYMYTNSRNNRATFHYMDVFHIGG
ncbi:MAG: hypothetical protein ACE5GL_04905, partial [Calditrichia bacterium]